MTGVWFGIQLNSCVYNVCYLHKRPCVLLISKHSVGLCAHKLFSLLLVLHIAVGLKFGCDQSFYFILVLWIHFQYLFRKPTKFFFSFRLADKLSTRATLTANLHLPNWTFSTNRIMKVSIQNGIESIEKTKFLLTKIIQI